MIVHRRAEARGRNCAIQTIEQLVSDNMKAGEEAMSEYALALDDIALKRYHLMARLAYDAERGQWEAAGVRAGAAVADAGCGPGAVLAQLGELVGPQGRVIGIDSDPAALSAAAAVASSAGLTNVSFNEADVAATGLRSGSMDVIMLRHVLGHNGGREQQIVDHLASCLRPGGSLYIVDTVLEGMRIWPANREIQEMLDLYLDFQAAKHNDLSIGLKLKDLLSAAGLEPINFQGRYEQFDEAGFRPPAWEAREAMISANYIARPDVPLWQQAFTRLEQCETSLTYFVPLFTATGRRPAA